MTYWTISHLGIAPVVSKNAFSTSNKHGCAPTCSLSTLWVLSSMVSRVTLWCFFLLSFCGVTPLVSLSGDTLWGHSMVFLSSVTLWCHSLLSPSGVTLMNWVNWMNWMIGWIEWIGWIGWIGLVEWIEWIGWIGWIEWNGLIGWVKWIGRFGWIK